MQRKSKMTNKIPFLHTQILECAIISDTKKDSNIDLDLLSEETGYPANSKILNNAIQKLNDKGFLEFELIETDCQESIKIKICSEKKEFVKKILQDKKKEKRFIPNINFEEYFNNFQRSRAYQDKLNKTKLESVNEMGFVHRWYDYLEDFPFDFTWQKIEKHCKKKTDIVLDPFSGSGTTLVTAKLKGHNAYGIDANPLMQFISKNKTTWNVNLEEFKQQMFKVNSKLLKGFKNIDSVKIKNKFLETMPKRELNQWLSFQMQKQVAYTKDVINEIKDKETRDLFLFSMAKSAFDGSYVALCPGTTFYPYRRKTSFYELFVEKLNQIYYDLKELSKMNHYGKVEVINGDSRQINELIPKKVKLSLTSPPYPNDLEYTRQTRLELYLLDFVKDMNEVQSLKKKMVKGSTKLIYKESDSAKFVKNNKIVNEVSDKIGNALKEKNWGFDYPRMIREYFGDMYLSLKNHLDILDDEGVYLLVVGDQTYKNIVIPTGKILAEMGLDLGYKKAEIEHHRMRRSTTHNIPLPEENVILYK